MATPKPYDRIAFVASASTEAQAALAQPTKLYGNHVPMMPTSWWRLAATG